MYSFISLFARRGGFVAALNYYVQFIYPKMNNKAYKGLRQKEQLISHPEKPLYRRLNWEKMREPR